MDATREAIAKRAYELYMKDGCQEGHCQKYWHEAERQVTRKDVADQKAENDKREEAAVSPDYRPNDVEDAEDKPSGSP